jgi:hypothetical protein
MFTCHSRSRRSRRYRFDRGFERAYNGSVYIVMLLFVRLDGSTKKVCALCRLRIDPDSVAAGLKVAFVRGHDSDNVASIRLKIRDCNNRI